MYIWLALILRYHRASRIQQWTSLRGLYASLCPHTNSSGHWLVWLILCASLCLLIHFSGHWLVWLILCASLCLLTHSSGHWLVWLFLCASVCPHTHSSGQWLVVIVCADEEAYPMRSSPQLYERTQRTPHVLFRALAQKSEKIVMRNVSRISIAKVCYVVTLDALLSYEPGRVDWLNIYNR